MKAKLWDAYYTPATVTEALALLHHHGDDARLIAGGTDLIIDMQNGNHAPVVALIDVTHISRLQEIREIDGWIELGAAVTHAQIEQSALLQQQATALVEACRVVGGPQVRNVATLGGNVAHALPAADGTIGLLALDAEVEISTRTGESSSEVDEQIAVHTTWLPLLDIFAGPGRNTLASNQMITAFRFAPNRSHEASAFDRIMRPQGIALPILGVAARLRLAETEPAHVVDAIIAIGPAGPIPFRATEAEQVLTSAGRLDDEVVNQAVAAAQAQAQLRTSKHRATQAYRHEMVGVLLRRVLTRAAARTELRS